MEDRPTAATTHTLSPTFLFASAGEEMSNGGDVFSAAFPPPLPRGRRGEMGGRAGEGNLADISVYFSGKGKGGG